MEWKTLAAVNAFRVKTAWVLRQALFDLTPMPSYAVSSWTHLELVGASGFEPPSYWSRTSLDQAKSVELTAFACAFPLLIWATWATKYRWLEFRLFAVAHVPVASRLLEG